MPSRAPPCLTDYTALLHQNLFLLRIGDEGLLTADQITGKLNGMRRARSR